MLNELLRVDAAFGDEAIYRLRYITDLSEKGIEAIGNKHSHRPTMGPETPVIGASVYNLNKIFLDKLSKRHGFGRRCFLVLDDWTEESQTLLVVEACDPAKITPEEPGIETLRADFYASRQIVTLSEIGKENLLEYRDNDKIYRQYEFEMDL